MDALIGYTGFVGSCLNSQKQFEITFNSSNIQEIKNYDLETVYCAAAPGSMLKANRDPKEDHENISSLIDCLKSVRARKFILISSIAVLPDFHNGYDEKTKSFQTSIPYGRNRRELENFVEGHFQKSLILRLPALFGFGLKKNLIFDLLNPVPTMLPQDRFDNLLSLSNNDLRRLIEEVYSFNKDMGMMQIDRTLLNLSPIRKKLEKIVYEHGFSADIFHNPETTYQFYDTRNLIKDVQIAIKLNLSHIHLVNEPIKVSDIYSRLIGNPMPKNNAKLHKEDIHTIYSKHWGEVGPYLCSAKVVLDNLSEFYTQMRSTQN